MYLQAIALQNFRNHQQFHFAFDDTQVVFVAPNGAGKTNIIEAIHLLATGDTFRDAKTEEMVAFDAEVGHVAGKIRNSKSEIRNNNQIQNSNGEDNETELRVTVTRGVWQGKRVAKKRFQVNGVGRSKPKFLDNLHVVCFRPEDLRIIEGSPGRRRKFLDTVISQIDTPYSVALKTYGKALRQRNKLLDMIREGKTHPRALEYWDDLVIKHGSYINEKRQQMIDSFNSGCEVPDRRVFGDHSTVEDDNAGIKSLPTLSSNYEMIYDHSIISRERLDQYRDQERAAAHTLVGPHRDDFLLKSQVTSDMRQEQKDLAKYGSRGQQRMGVLWLKIQSLHYMQSVSNQQPVLLLDDIFSELDHEHRQIVFDLMKHYQTIATTADEHYVDENQVRLVDLTELMSQ